MLGFHTEIVYTFCIQKLYKMYTTDACIQNVYKMYTKCIPYFGELFYTLCKQN